MSVLTSLFLSALLSLPLPGPPGLSGVSDSSSSENGHRAGVILAAAAERPVGATLSSGMPAEMFARAATEPFDLASVPVAELTAIDPDPIIQPVPDPAVFDRLEVVFPQGVGVTSFIDSWGFARAHGSRRHQGTDLMAPKMSPVYALADGVIERLSSGGTSGRTVSVKHDFGYSSWYMHLNNDVPGTDDGNASIDQIFAPGLEVGHRVSAGDLVGFVGDSGNAESTAPHTHFELHRNAVPINPYPALRQAQERALELANIAEAAERFLVVVELAE